MGKLTTYIIMMSGLMLLFYLTGLIQECTNDGLCETTTPNSQLLNLVLKPQDISLTTLETNVELAIAGVGVVLVIAAGLFIGNVELAVMGSLSIYLISLFLDFLAVFNRIREANPVLALLFFAPIMFMYILIVAEWWRGGD